MLIGLLPRLWRPAASSPFLTLTRSGDHLGGHAGGRWRDAGSPFERSLLDLALDALAALPGDVGETVLLHQDLHPGNVLSAGREPWLAIDATPVVGERAFGAVPLVRTSMLVHDRAGVRYRLDRVSAELGLDRERVRLWTVVQALNRGLRGEYLEQRLATARWLRDR